ncbi:MAG: hypothetical protein JNN05_11395 [Candidatus Omnitrophica bacterium]|nr:hypothetical protein [Candidatus Omnitrophota bacterium]
MTIRERILANIKTTLESVTIANGYVNTIASVQRWDKRGNALRQVPCIVVNAGQEEKQMTPNPYFTCRLSVYLDVWIRQDDADSTATDVILSGILGDIEKALMIDNTRGGFAIDTNIKSNVPFETVEGQPHAGLTIELEILYQHTQSDPSIA